MNIYIQKIYTKSTKKIQYIHIQIADELWSVFNSKPALLAACVRLLRYDAGGDSGNSVLLDFRVSMCVILARLLGCLQSGEESDRKVNAVLTAGLFPTLLWLRRRFPAHSALSSAPQKRVR